MTALLIVILAATEPALILHPVKDEATHELLRAATREKDPVERLKALNALKIIGDPVELPPRPAALPANPFVERLQSGDAAFVLESLQQPDLLIQQEAICAAHRLRLAGAVPLLLPLLKSPDAVLRRLTCEALAEFGGQPEVVPALVARVADEDPFVRRAAANGLLKIHNASAQAGLLSLATHERADVRLEVAVALGLWPEIAPDTLQRLLDDKDTGVAAAAAEGLGKIRLVEAVTQLIRRLDSTPVSLQRAIIVALGQIRSEAALPVFLRFLNAAADELAAASAEAMGQSGATQTIPALRKAVGDFKKHASGARLRAIEALRRLGDRESIELVLQIATRPVLPPLPGESGLMFETDEVREECLRYLAGTGDAKLADRLAGAFKELPPFNLRLALASTLGVLTGKRYRAIPDEDVRHYGIESLAASRYPWSPASPGVAPAE